MLPKRKFWRWFTMFPKTVLCIYGRSLSEFIEQLSLAEKTEVPILEIRADYLRLEDLTKNTLQTIRVLSKRKLIFTLRKRREGGKIVLSDQQRRKFFFQAIELGYDFVDIEFSSSRELIKSILIRKGPTKIILSYHDFQKTDGKIIEQYYQKMQELNPDIIKIVTMAQKEQDNETVLHLLEKAKSQGSTITCFCMGERGKKSRFAGYKNGNALTFLALKRAKATAKGQITYDEFLKELK
ncbi:MAG: type I 3-dehydroquinate dehydratase [Candidatus Heimdallarchaeota archaeon]|nr:type I 3-dehydroquinate dehydratase [Candidatus Heimdallarchaeota archaeon]